MGCGTDEKKEMLNAVATTVLKRTIVIIGEVALNISIFQIAIDFI
jgi:hypothetical protein